MAPDADTTTSGRSVVRGGNWYHEEVAVRAGSRPNGSATFDPFTPTGPFPPAVPAESLMAALGLLGDASELTTPGLVTTGYDLRSSPTPLGLNPTGLMPPRGPSGPKVCHGIGCSRPTLGSGSVSTSSAMAQLLGDSPDSNAARLALAVV